jgi:P4 family phage/plasmid primase-like protien
VEINSQRVVRQLQELLGPAVLLPIKRGKKGPEFDDWQTTTLADMTPENLAVLDYRHNIGVLLGKASAGLCSIDVDAEEDVAPFLALNPKLESTLRTKGKRGCNLWIRVKGQFPGLHTITHRTKTNGDGKPLKVGEWRADGGQTVIWGAHPSGCKYRRVVKSPPVEIEFSEIQWPDDWVRQEPTITGSDLEAKHGAPYSIAQNGRVSLNTSFFAAKFAAERLTLWHPGEQQFYQYDETSGLWRITTKDAIKLQFACDLKQFADETQLPEIHNWRTNHTLTDLTELLKGHVENADAFAGDRHLVHLKNCVLDLSTDPPRRLEFSPDFFSRNQTPFDFVDGADCPRFKTELLASALNADDIGLLQRWGGAVLVKHNAAQKILLLTGTAGGGKSTLADIVERIIGPDNCAELRTDLLYERFELARFVGKTLLSGKDVPGDFLQRKGASALKKLVGHDLLSAELKNANRALLLKGDFHVLCTCNTRLQVRLDGDTDAWRRRLLLVEYSRPKPPQPIRDFADKLIEAEASGILNWLLQGAVRHLAELEATGDYCLTEAQQGRIENLLNESDSVALFVRQCVVPAPDADVTTEELLRDYFDFCDEKGWVAKDRTTVCELLPHLMLQVHRVSRRHDVERNGKPQRGYDGVDLV